MIKNKSRILRVGWFVAAFAASSVLIQDSLVARQATCFSVKQYSPKSGRSQDGEKCVSGFIKFLGNLITFGLTTATCPAESWIEPGGTACDNGGIYEGCFELQRRITILTDKNRCNDRNECVVVGHGTTQVIQLMAWGLGQCGSDPPHR